MKAISIRQPWASMIVKGHKPVENRSWRSFYRGALHIHAAKTWDQAGAEWIIKNFVHLERDVADARALCGGIIGRVIMVGCVRQHASPWFAGKWGFVFSDPESCELRPCPGRLGVFNLPHTIK
ncbi:MAG: ASCH domain-containing protein, partial [Desulfobacterales bacterium]|nr:ASCH domain-containing protein [Desulfobacterales bacterium]